MKQMIYQVAVGPKSKLYEHCIDSVANYCKKFVFSHIVHRRTILRIYPNIFATILATPAFNPNCLLLRIYGDEHDTDDS